MIFQCESHCFISDIPAVSLCNNPKVRQLVLSLISLNVV